MALSVGISKGNLTYHFNKKEAIVVALLADSGREELTKMGSDVLRDIGSRK